MPRWSASQCRSIGEHAWEQGYMTRKSFELDRMLMSGITVRVENRAEWILYNDIFVDGEYDLPINNVLASAPRDRPLEFLDIGGNVGFFALRVADRIIRSENPKVDFRITLVEGSPDVYEELKCRLMAEPALANKLTLVHGLVGRRRGSAKIYECGFHANNSLFPRNTFGGCRGVDVPFVDLFSLYGENPVIDLMKCDIEGAELMFLESYQELLAGVRYAVIEFHHHLCDVARCFDILEEVGFSNYEQLCSREKTMNSVYLFGRQVVRRSQEASQNERRKQNDQGFGL